MSKAPAASLEAAASASRTVGKTWNTRLKWLISKISATIACSAATKMRPCCALAWREASMKQRSPALETYSSADRSRITAPPSWAAVSTCAMRSARKASQLSWSSLPVTPMTSALA